MEKERPHEIEARHLARKAVIYVRQSSEEQVLHNTCGSRELDHRQISAHL